MDIIIDNSKKRRRKKIIFITVGVLLVALLALSFRNSGERRYACSIDKFTIATVTKANFGEYIAIEGKAMPMKSIFLDAIEGGVIEKIWVEDGALVEKNQPLLELSNTNLQLDIRDGKRLCMNSWIGCKQQKLITKKIEQTYFCSFLILIFNIWRPKKICK